MPPFDEWGLRPVGLVGPPENPVTVVPLLVAGAELAPSVDTGGQVLPEVRCTGAEAPMLPEAPEAPSSGTHDPRPRAAVARAMQLAAPKAKVPEASASRREAEPDSSSQLGAPEVVSLGASPVALSSLDSDVDARLKAEGLRLMEERHKLKVAINLGRHQCELDNAKAEVSLAASREACTQALEEAREADRRREVAEKRAWELQAWSISLEQQVEARKFALASMRGTPAEEEEILKREEVLALEVVECSLELERLETRERQVAQAEDAPNVREARIHKKVDSRVAEARADLVGRYDLKLELVEAEAVGRTTALRTELAKVEQREKAAAAALVSAQAELASARAELFSLQQRVANAESFT
nr:uncharacterized protein LOC109780517 [Aegilops tauschii subsp. strangulata]